MASNGSEVDGFMIKASPISRLERKRIISRDHPDHPIESDPDAAASFKKTVVAITCRRARNLRTGAEADASRELFLKYRVYGSRTKVRQLRRDGICNDRHRVGVWCV